MEENGIKIEESMVHMENNLERIVKILQNLEEKLPKCDDVGRGTQDDKDFPHIQKASINKHASRGSD